MRSLAILTLIAAILASIAPPADAQTKQTPRELDLLARLKKAEAENLRLRSEVDRLRALEADLRHLKLLGREHAEETPETGGRRPMPGMPYDEELYFLVESTDAVGSRAPDGAVKYTLTVDLIELDPKAREDSREHLRDGWTWVSIGSTARADGRRYRMTIEDLKPGEARRLLADLEPRPETGAEGEVTTLLRRVGFNRVETDATYMGRYPGNSGTVRIHRKKLYWYENSVFFLEDGVLRIRGEKPARHHLRFFAPLRRR